MSETTEVIVRFRANTEDFVRSMDEATAAVNRFMDAYLRALPWHRRLYAKALIRFARWRRRDARPR